MNIQMDSLTLKIIDYLWNDAKIMDNLLGLNIHRLVRNFLHKEFQNSSPTFSIQEYNEFIDEFNKFIESKKHPEKENDAEDEEDNKYLLFNYVLEKMKGFPLFLGFPMDYSHQINTFYNVAIIVYFILCKEFKTNSINVLDLTKFIPEPFGFDLDFETPSGLILRYISIFRKAHPKYASMAKINGTAFTSDDLTNYLCKTGYPEIQWLSSSKQVLDAKQLLYNAAIINTQNKPPSYIDHFIEDGQDYEIDFTKYENELKKAIASTDQNHFIISVLPVSIICKEAIPMLDFSEHSLPKITDDIVVLRPKAEDWERLYSLYSHYRLRINSIFCIDTVFSMPDSPWENEPGMCILFLTSENVIKNDKILLTEFENNISLEEMLNIVKRKGKVAIGNWVDTTTVFYLRKR